MQAALCEVQVIDMTTINTAGPVLPTELADRIDSMYEAIRRTKRSLVIDDDVIALLRGQVSAFITLLVDTFKGIGYQADSSSYSHTRRPEVYVYIGGMGLVIDLWHSLTASYHLWIPGAVTIVNRLPPPLIAYTGSGQYVPGIRYVVECLDSIAATVATYKQCKDCYWSGGGSGYCGLGMVPEGICSHYYSNEVIPT